MHAHVVPRRQAVQALLGHKDSRRRAYTPFLDACVRGPVAEGLRRRGWDLVRAVDLHGEGALDPRLFEHAATLGRVFVTNDASLLALAIEWLEAGRA